MIIQVIFLWNVVFYKKKYLTLQREYSRYNLEMKKLCQ